MKSPGHLSVVFLREFHGDWNKDKGARCGQRGKKHEIAQDKEATGDSYFIFPFREVKLSQIYKQRRDMNGGAGRKEKQGDGLRGCSHHARKR